MLVQVQDAQHKPVRKLEIGIEGFGASAVTGNDGKAKLPIGSAAVPGDSISLAVLHSPPGKDFVMISPWDNRAIVPSFEDKPANFIRVVVVQRGDRAALESNTVLLSLGHLKINSANAPKQTGGQIPAQGPAGPADAEQEQVHDPKANLKAVAMEYGLDPTEVDEALKALGAKTTIRTRLARSRFTRTTTARQVRSLSRLPSRSERRLLRLANRRSRRRSCAQPKPRAFWVYHFSSRTNLRRRSRQLKKA